MEALASSKPINHSGLLLLNLLMLVSICLYGTAQDSLIYYLGSSKNMINLYYYWFLLDREGSLVEERQD